MKEMFKEAERLYKQLDKAQVDFFKSRLNKDDNATRQAISELGSASCSAMQFLKCIIERKDNIVDLGEVWHTLDDNTFTSNRDDALSDIIVFKDDSLCDIHTLPALYNWLGSIGARQGQAIWKQIKWTYTKDLLPKGGEAWNTTK